MEVYDKQEDATGIFISLLPRKFKEVRQHFENKFVYMVDANFGSLIHNKEIKKLNFEKYKAHLKRRRTLLECIRTRLKEEEFIEFFLSWADEERLERIEKFDTIVYFDDEESIEKIDIKDRQYVRFYLTNK